MAKELLLPLVSILFFFPLELLAQRYIESEELEYRRVRVTLVPPLSTNGVEAPNYTARYSYNLIAGYHGGLDGFEIGPVNITKHYMHGIQVGVLNIAGGTVRGVQIGGLGNISRANVHAVQLSGIGNFTNGFSEGMAFSGIANVSGRGMTGISMAGMFNLSGGSIEGIQIAGFANVARQNIEGLQISGVMNSSSGSGEGLMIAGLANMNRGHMEGLMISGGVNVANRLEGLLISGLLNSGRNMEGLMISGGANISRRATGLQIGLINVAEHFEGLPIGLISYYGNGRKNIELWTNENGFTHAGLKLGTKEIYNMISVGHNPFLSDRDVWSVGWSIGSYRTLGEIWNRPGLDHYYKTRDFSIHMLQEGKWGDTLNNLFSYRLIYGRNFSSGFSLFAGPTFNMLVSRQDGNEDYVPYTIYKRTSGDRDTRFWVGFTAGVQLFRH